MKHRYVFPLLAVGLVALAPLRARAQGWQPPSKQMPEMPARAELQGGAAGWAGAWLGSQAGAAGVGADQVRAVGEGARGPKAAFVRFTSGVFPVATWSDRNGDGRADMIEVFRDGARIVQLIDPDYDGTANVMRVYSASGELLREERM
ncbi:MAG: hypothetical protein JO040_03650 [Gemmatimonadetes bacterium]|nr:hypothetical protein [Gemmatimonadota bacterium]